MKFSEQWLREWADPKLARNELAHRITMAGLEVDAIDAVAGAFAGVVVARIVSADPHPDADKLRLCQVDDGSGETVQIVCGATNARPGLVVPLARVGAELPGGLKIRKAKLRGVESFGMLCSASELGLAESAEGLLELSTELTPGTDLRQALALDDVSITLGLTPNRGDCLSILGLAREVSALTGCELRVPYAEAPVLPTHEQTLAVAIAAEAACPRYVGRVVRGVDAAATTPLWMVERLRRCGLRSLGPLVDVTNYVLLELGQPMHAFDLQRIKGGIEVRMARQGERLTLLDGRTIELSGEDLVIADGEGPLALAGIMGGEASAVGDTTRDIFLESAFFAPRPLAGRARSHGLHTDSSHRFERGVDPQLQRRAIERATALLLSIAGGEPGPLVEVASAGHLPQPAPVTVRSERVERVLGVELSGDECQRIFTALGMQAMQQEGCWLVTPPPWRFDIAIEADLIEELARVHTYERIPATLPRGQLAVAPRSEGRLGVRTLRRTLAARGYREAITFSFVEPGMQARIDPNHTPVALANPISHDLSVLRTTLWAGLLPVAAGNLKRQQERVRLFETGLRFIPDEAGRLAQRRTLAGLACGSALPEQWGSPRRVIDFFDVKGDVEALIALTAHSEDFRFTAATHPALHPGQCARILRGDEAVGWIGVLHPQWQRELDLPALVLFELDLERLESARVPAFRPISRFPAVRRDIALLVDRALPVQSIIDCIVSIQDKRLQDVILFDLYQGERIDSGKKSVALGLTLREQEGTLTDAETDAFVEEVVARLGKQLGASLRE